MKRIYSEVTEDLFRKYKAFLEMNDMKMTDHIRLTVIRDVMQWEREHPEEAEYYRQLTEIEDKLKKLRAP